MASNQILKKSVVGGFRKEDVINYVEQLQAEIQRLRNDLAQKNSESEQCDELKNAYAEAAKSVEAANAELESVRAEKTALAAENELLRVEKQSLEAVIETLKKEKADAEEIHASELEQIKTENENKISLFEEKLASIESTFASIEASRSKNNVADEKAKILKDANDNSDLIITRANNEARAIAEKANAAVAQAAKQVAKANERLKSACVNYDSSTVELKSSVDSLIAVLDSVMECGGAK